MNNTEIYLKETDLYTIKFERRPKYLYAVVSGKDNNLEIVKSYWQDLFDECQKHGFDKLLVEGNLEGDISMHEVYKFACEFSQKDFREILVAYVDRHSSHQQLNRFGELVASNRGARGRVFDSVSDAKQWLLIN